MAVEAQLCPQCGGAIHFAESQRELICPYCGTTIVNPTLPPSVQVAAATQPELEAQMIVGALFAQHIRLSTAGVLAPAKIVAAQPTKYVMNTSKGKGQVMMLVVEVQPDGGQPFTAQFQALVSLQSLDKYQAGTLGYVRYDPHDPTQLEFDHRQ